MNHLDIQSVSLRSFTAAIALASVLTISLNAQEKEGAKEYDKNKGTAAQKVERTGPEYTTTSRIVGADVYLTASAEAVEEAKKAGKVPEAGKASVTEWLVRSSDGTLEYAVVSVGGFLGMGDKTVLVPCAELKWNNSMERFALGWTKAELEARPVFDLAQATAAGIDKACAAAMPNKALAVKATVDASVTPSATIPGTTFLRPSSELCRVSEITNLPVYAGTEVFGKISDMIVDRKQHQIVLAIVNHDSTLGLGGTNYLVPLADLKVATREGGSMLLCATMKSGKQLEASVVFEKPKNGVVDPAAAAKALGLKEVTEKQ
jgi:hypothetical protein